MPHDPDAFLGAWRLVAWRIDYPDGGATHPFGPDAHGYIVYAPGVMTASIARAGRPLFGLANARAADAAAKAGAFDGYFHYAGPWSVDGDHVVHHVTMALNPDMAGTDQRRLARFDGHGGLVLSAPEEMRDGRIRDHVLAWQRV